MIQTQYTPMIQQYLQIKSEYQDAFLFFRLGDFYELFFEDAILASKELEITLTGRVGGTEEKIPMCGVPYHSSEQYIKKLIDKGYKVAVCEQTEDPKQAQGVVKREVLRVITPGTVMEPAMLREKENNFILFIAKKMDQYTLLACDLSTGELLGTTCQALTQLIDEIPSYHAVEIVILDELFTDKEKELLLQYYRHSIQWIPRQTYSEESWQKHTTILFTEDQISSLTPSIEIMFAYLEETQKRAIEHLKALQYYEPDSFMKLDSFSKRNLELTQSIREGNKKGSLLWLLDQTSTAMGGRLIKKWIQRPLRNRTQIEQRLQAVSTLITYSLEREELVQYLDQVYDLERLAVRVSYGSVNPRDLLQLKKSLEALPGIQEFLNQLPNCYLQEEMRQIDLCQDLVELLERALVDDPPISIKDGGIFQQGYHPELDRLLEASLNGKRWILELEALERQKTGIKTLKVGYNKVFGYYIEVTKSNTHLLEEGRYERKQTLANAERYITPELKEKEALILEATEKLTELEYQLFVELREQVNQYTTKLQLLAEKIAQIDVICSFARVSEKYRYVKPSFNDERILSIDKGRHPVVERVLKDSQYIANDILMDHKKRQILLITGPNMAGKSTYMRQVALISVMAQMGCYVPANEANLPVFDQIFTRIGAADDLVGGQSTFMVEMMETKQAITQATEDSLILLDEIGRGTSTYDGMSLAQSVVEYIHDRVQAKTLFSTHYHELTDLSQHLERLTNVHVACSENEGRVIFLHTVKEGKADRSYGIHVAQLAELPEEIIRRAEQILIQLEGKNQGSDESRDHETIKRDQAEKGPEQLSLFAPVESVQLPKKQLTLIKEIEELNLLSMTPLDALNFLYQFQQKVKKS